MGTPDDADAILRCQRGDPAGLEPLIARYQIPALRLAYLLMGDRALAEDVVQDSFLLVYRGIHRFQPERPFAPWLYRIVTNTARQRQRSIRRRRETSLEAVLPQEPAPSAGAPRADQIAALAAADPAEHAERAEAQAAFSAALATLSRKQREAIVLHYYLGYSSQEAATALGCRPGAARQRLHDGLVALRAVLQARYPWLVNDLPHDPTAPTQEVTPYVAPEL